MRESGTKRRGAALVATAAFFGFVGVDVGGGMSGNERVALAVERSSSAEEAAWEKAATKEKTPWRSESGGAAFLPPRPEQAPVSLAPKSEPRSLEGLRTVAEVYFSIRSGRMSQSAINSTFSMASHAGM